MAYRFLFSFGYSFLLSILLSCGVGMIMARPCQARIVDRIAAIVNDEIITQSDADAYKQKLKGASFSDDLLVSDDKIKTQALQDDKKLLNLLIDAKILDYEIKKQN